MTEEGFLNSQMLRCRSDGAWKCCDAVVAELATNLFEYASFDKLSVEYIGSTYGYNSGAWSILLMDCGVSSYTTILFTDKSDYHARV